MSLSESLDAAILTFLVVTWLWELLTEKPCKVIVVKEGSKYEREVKCAAHNPDVSTDFGGDTHRERSK